VVFTSGVQLATLKALRPNVDEQGRGEVARQRLHQLVRGPGSIADRTVEIAFLEAGAEAYCFTFG
jgi:hypothetical protein